MPRAQFFVTLSEYEMGYQHPATPSDVLDDSFSGRLNRSRFRVTRPTLARLCCKFRDLAAAQLGASIFS